MPPLVPPVCETQAAIMSVAAQTSPSQTIADGIRMPLRMLISSTLHVAIFFL